MDDMLRDKKYANEIIGFKASSDNFSTGNTVTNAGCTANVALITNPIIYVANSGDARSVIEESSIANPLSIDHKPEDPVEKDRITKAGGFV